MTFVAYLSPVEGFVRRLCFQPRLDGFVAELAVLDGKKRRLRVHLGGERHEPAVGGVGLITFSY